MLTIFFVGVTSYMLTASIVEWCEKRGEEEAGKGSQRREKVGAHFHLLFLVLHASVAEAVKKANAEQGEEEKESGDFEKSTGNSRCFPRSSRSLSQPNQAVTAHSKIKEKL